MAGGLCRPLMVNAGPPGPDCVAGTSYWPGPGRLEAWGQRQHNMRRWEGNCGDWVRLSVGVKSRQISYHVILRRTSEQ